MFKLDRTLAQSIVDRSMKIIGGNVNVMDERGTIIASGDRDRIGEMHDGALLVLSRQGQVDIDEAMAAQLTRVRPGVNLPLIADGAIVGCVGLTGNPAAIRQHAELVRMAAETMLEQAKLLRLLARDARLREDVTLGLIEEGGLTPAITGWAQRLGIALDLPRVAVAIEVEAGALEFEAMTAELQRLPALLGMPDRADLIAATTLNEIVMLRPALDRRGTWNAAEQRNRAEHLLMRLRETSPLFIRLALGQYFEGSDGLVQSWQTARTTMRIGRARRPRDSAYFYDDFMLPVLVDDLKQDWRAQELLKPLKGLQRDRRGQHYLDTLQAWFSVGMKPAATATVLGIHRNSLDYRLQRIQDLCGVDLSVTEDCVRLYLALQMLDGDGHAAHP